MLDICYEEFENLREWLGEGREILGYNFLDTWDFEYEYSHNHIAENRNKFIELANEYFQDNNLPYEARETCERTNIFQKNRI